MQHLWASSQVLQTKDLREKLTPLDATLTQNRGYPTPSQSFRPFRSPILRVPFWNSPLVTVPSPQLPYASNAREITMALFGDGGRRELEKKAKADGRLPPGQSLTLKWPVLHYGSVPHFDAAKWDFKISGLVEEPVQLSWEEFRALPQSEVTSDFHCVTLEPAGQPLATRAVY